MSGASSASPIPAASPCVSLKASTRLAIRRASSIPKPGSIVPSISSNSFARCAASRVGACGADPQGLVLPVDAAKDQVEAARAEAPAKEVAA